MPIFSHFDLQMAVSWVSLIKFQGNKCSQLCLTLCDPVDCSPPGSPVHRIFQARILEWGAMPSSRGSSRCRDQTCVSCIAGRFFSTGASLVAQKVKHLPAVQETWVRSLCWEDTLEKKMATHSSILAWRFSTQEYRSGLHFLLQGDLPNPGIEPRSPALQADSLPSAQPGKPIESIQYSFINVPVVWASLTSCLFFFLPCIHWYQTEDWLTMGRRMLWMCSLTEWWNHSTWYHLTKCLMWRIILKCEKVLPSS